MKSVITVRLPAELHERLKEEAYQHRRSMNQLCIQKLMLPMLAEVQGDVTAEDAESAEP